MTGTIKVQPTGFTKTANLEGNRNRLQQDVFIETTLLLGNFYTEKILKTDKTLGLVTELKAKRINVVGGSVITDTSGQPEVLETTIISSPETFITLASNTLYNWYYTSVNAISVTDGYYVFEFTDGVYSFETDITCRVLGAVPVGAILDDITGYILDDAGGYILED